MLRLIQIIHRHKVVVMGYALILHQLQIAVVVEMILQAQMVMNLQQFAVMVIHLIVLQKDAVKLLRYHYSHRFKENADIVITDGSMIVGNFLVDALKLMVALDLVVTAYPCKVVLQYQMKMVQ